MFLSVFDIFKIGIGPSSSHTMGPMVAASKFLDELRSGNKPGFKTEEVQKIRVSLHGSLAFTGKGHATDRAVMLGLNGYLPHTVNPDQTDEIIAQVYSTHAIKPTGFEQLQFDPKEDLIFDYENVLPGHTNGLKFFAYDELTRLLLESTYYSIGGGFVLTEEELNQTKQDGFKNSATSKQSPEYPYPFQSAKEMLAMGDNSGMTIAEMKLANEETDLNKEEVTAKLREIWEAMKKCIDRGLRLEGELPGGLKVKRRAKNIQDQLLAQQGSNMIPPHVANDWLSVYAMAVNEENACGGRVVTSPTNGAAGVVPSVIRYYCEHCPGGSESSVNDFLLTAAAIGGLIKHNASISGAECGCQAEVGSAAAMAAAGLCAVMGGTNAQIENAAEIALEHHLGMTCDPVKGLVQVPCIERNGLGAIKAVSAASLALHGDGQHFMPLDNCIETMRQTGLDMQERYKETSQGGLAVNFPEC